MQTLKACGLVVLNMVAPAVLALANLLWELTGQLTRPRGQTTECTLRMMVIRHF